MLALETALLVVYFSVLALASIYGLHRYLLVFLFYRHRSRAPVPEAPLEPLPTVTVQLPVYNEVYVIERLIRAACALDYPREKLEIQVLDDSTDETSPIAERCVREMEGKGVRIRHIHRSDRMGFKAGALANGLDAASGELIAVFDADFVPSPDFLLKAIDHFSDPRVGMVQARWGHLNRDYSLITRLQSILLDGHFVIEHAARNRSGRFFNFNGTAGIWRRSCIEAAGGWEHDTLTEDLDLSYRAQLAGWRFVFLLDLVAPGEVPVEMNAFKSQQHRWAMGSIQTARKILGRVLASPHPFKVKAEAFFHLTGNVSYLLMTLLTILVLPSIVVRSHLAIERSLWVDLPLFLAATASVSLFYLVSQWEGEPDGWRRLRYLPLVLSLGVGLSLNNSKAVLDALLRRSRGFHRTPKYAIESNRDSWAQKQYRQAANWLPLIEGAFAAYMALTLFYALVHGLWLTLPFLFLFFFGYSYTAILSTMQADRGETSGGGIARLLAWIRPARAWIAFAPRVPPLR